jgi:hypothetical protein
MGQSGPLVPAGPLIPSGSPLRTRAQYVFDEMPSLVNVQQHSHINSINQSQLNTYQNNLNRQSQSDENQLQSVKVSVIRSNNQRPSIIKDTKTDLNNSSKDNQHFEDIEEFVDIGSETLNMKNTKVNIKTKFYVF